MFKNIFSKILNDNNNLEIEQGEHLPKAEQLSIFTSQVQIEKKKNNNNDNKFKGDKRNSQELSNREMMSKNSQIRTKDEILLFKESNLRKNEIKEMLEDQKKEKDNNIEDTNDVQQKKINELKINIYKRYKEKRKKKILLIFKVSSIIVIIGSIIIFLVVFFHF